MPPDLKVIDFTYRGAREYSRKAHESVDKIAGCRQAYIFGRSKGGKGSIADDAEKELGHDLGDGAGRRDKVIHQRYSDLKDYGLFIPKRELLILKKWFDVDLFPDTPVSRGTSRGQGAQVVIAIEVVLEALDAWPDREFAMALAERMMTATVIEKLRLLGIKGDDPV